MRAAQDEEAGGGGKGKFLEMGTSSNSRSFEVESWAFVPYQHYSLQLMQRVEPPLDRNTIPATLQERLAFFRLFTSTVASTQKVSLCVLNFNRFIWNMAYNHISKSLLMNYLHLFLSAYVPHEHMFVAKMVPFMIGYNWLMVFCILSNFVLCTEMMSIVLYFGVWGFFKGNPWYREVEKVFLYDETIVNYKEWIVLFAFLVSIGIFYRQMYKKAIWQEFDFDMFSDSVVVPPILHFIAARSSQHINPTGDSALLLASNGLHYLLKCVTWYMMRRYCEHHYDISLVVTTGSNSLFYLWPMYLEMVWFGKIVSSLLFLIMGVTEFLCFVITYNVGLETIESEWPRLKWWIVLIITFPFSVVMKKIFYDSVRKAVMFVCVRSAICLIEMIIIVYLYPVARLEDDITFHTGSPPSKIMSIGLRLMPILYFAKLYPFLENFVLLFGDMKVPKAVVELFYYLMSFFSIPIILGVIYAVIKLLFIKKQDWRSLFRPVPLWGPRDHIQRQLRKQYDSREYIASTASRYLSRYLKSKLSSRMYRLDVCYETDRGRRRSTVVLDSLRYDDEKKKDV